MYVLCVSSGDRRKGLAYTLVVDGEEELQPQDEIKHYQ